MNSLILKGVNANRSQTTGFSALNLYPMLQGSQNLFSKIFHNYNIH
jgi:hypothetical protein